METLNPNHEQKKIQKETLIPIIIERHQRTILDFGYRNRDRLV